MKANERLAKTINIFPCIDGLLYAPVYLAISSFGFRKDIPAYQPRIARDDNDKILWTEWIFDDGLAIRLHKPAEKGDEGNYNRLCDTPNNDNHIAIAIGDPLEAFRKLRYEGREYRIVATFVNRIALWGVCNPSLVSNRQKAGNLRDLVKKAENGQIPLFFKNAEFGNLALGYCKYGATTSAIVERFAKPAFGWSGKQPGKLGYEEINGVRDKSYDITFSFEPWLLEAMIDDAKERNQYRVIPWFQSIPYPFSSLVILSEKPTEAGDFPGRNLLIEFLRHLSVGLALLYRYKNAARQLLIEMANPLRYYGFNSELQVEPKTRMVFRAFEWLVLKDCFCENMADSWIAWDLALEANMENLRGVSNKDMKDFHTKIRNETESSLRIAAASDEFVKNDFPQILKDMVSNAGSGETVSASGFYLPHP